MNLMPVKAVKPVAVFKLRKFCEERRNGWGRVFISNQGGSHVSTCKFIGVLAGGCLLCLGLSNCASNAGPASDAASVTDERKMDQSDPNTKSIKGEVLRVEGHDYVVRGEDGKEVSLHTDSTTQQMGDISQGYNIEAQVNDQNHALSIRSTPTTDRRNEKSNSMLAQ